MIFFINGDYLALGTYWDGIYGWVENEGHTITSDKAINKERWRLSTSPLAGINHRRDSITY